MCSEHLKRFKCLFRRLSSSVTGSDDSHRSGDHLLIVTLWFRLAIETFVAILLVICLRLGCLTLSGCYETVSYIIPKYLRYLFYDRCIVNFDSALSRWYSSNSTECQMFSRKKHYALHSRSIVEPPGGLSSSRIEVFARTLMGVESTNQLVLYSQTLRMYTK